MKTVSDLPCWMANVVHQPARALGFALAAFGLAFALTALALGIARGFADAFATAVSQICKASAHGTPFDHAVLAAS